MPRAVRAPEDIDVDRYKIARLLLQKKPIKAIAEELELDYGVVSRDVAALQKAWRSDASEMINQQRNQELMRLDMMAEEVEEKLQQSKVRVVTRIDENGDEVVTTTSTEGDPQWYKRQEWIFEQRAKILGLYAPKEQIIQRRDHNDLTEMSRAELEAIVAQAKINRAIEPEEVRVEYKEGGGVAERQAPRPDPNQ